jgi:hypothetical protein
VVYKEENIFSKHVDMNERDNFSSGDDEDEDYQNQSEDAYQQETFGRMADDQKKEISLRT